VNIAILGGTGKLGARLADGWAAAGHTIVLGSRVPESASAAYPVRSHTDAIRESDVVVIAVPASGAADVAEAIAQNVRDGATVLSVMIPLRAGDPTTFEAPSEGSIAAVVAARMREGIAVTSGFHTVAAHAVAEEGDVLICGQTKESRDLIAQLVRDLALNPVDCGPLRMSETLERLTPLLIGINRRFKVPGAGVRITQMKRPETNP
jgi:hypothetical protein